jgi:hypothetical protein
MLQLPYMQQIIHTYEARQDSMNGFYVKFPVFLSFDSKY